MSALSFRSTCGCRCGSEAGRTLHARRATPPRRCGLQPQCVVLGGDAAEAQEVCARAHVHTCAWLCKLCDAPARRRRVPSVRAPGRGCTVHTRHAHTRPRRVRGHHHVRDLRTMRLHRASTPPTRWVLSACGTWAPRRPRHHRRCARAPCTDHARTSRADRASAPRMHLHHARTPGAPHRPARHHAALQP